MTSSDELPELVERLAAMRDKDRNWVLEQLGTEAQRRLLPLVEQVRAARVSPPLKEFIAAASRDVTPSGMTPRGAQALVRAARDSGHSAPNLMARSAANWFTGFRRLLVAGR